MKFKNYLLLITLFIIIFHMILITGYGIRKLGNSIENNERVLLKKISNDFVNNIKELKKLKVSVDYYSKNKEIISKIILNNIYQLKFLTDEFINNAEIDRLLILDNQLKPVYRYGLNKINSAVFKYLARGQDFQDLLFEKNRIYAVYCKPITSNNKILGYIFANRLISKKYIRDYEDINNIKINISYAAIKYKTKNIIIYSKALYDFYGNKLVLNFQRDITAVQSILKDAAVDFIFISIIISILIYILVYFIFSKTTDSLNKLELSAEKIAKGNYDLNLPKSRVTEVDRVVEAFNLMGQQLKNTQNYLIQQEKLYLAGKLASGLSHELNNPLVGSLGYTQMLLEMTEDPEKRKYLENIEKNILRAKSIVKSLLNYSNKKNVNFYENRIKSIVDECIFLVNYKAKKNNVKINNEIKDSVILYTDKEILKQVLINLFLNAIDAFEDYTESGIITVTSKTEDEYTVIEVADNGPGIEDKIKNDVFEPFFTTKKERKGSGLGLFLCYNYMKQLKGKIKIEDNKPSGLKAKLYFETLKS